MHPFGNNDKQKGTKTMCYTNFLFTCALKVCDYEVQIFAICPMGIT